MEVNSFVVWKGKFGRDIIRLRVHGYRPDGIDKARAIWEFQSSVNIKVPMWQLIFYGTMIDFLEDRGNNATLLP